MRGHFSVGIRFRIGTEGSKRRYFGRDGALRIPVLSLYSRTVVRLAQSTGLSGSSQSEQWGGGKMDLRARFFLLMVSLASVSLLTGVASANPTALKCNSHRDQIWVYDSLDRFDIQAKLNCGENVEIVGRVNGYLKIR